MASTMKLGNDTLENYNYDLDGYDDVGNSCPGATKIIQIPPSTVGKVIGKGGSKIKSLQAQSGAKIHITDCQVRIIGEIPQVKKAEKMIHDLVGISKIIKVGHTQIGVLIGAKGVRIKSIQKESKATVKVTNQEGGSNADALVEITGTEEQIRHAEKLIKSSISNIIPITEMTVSGTKLKLKQLDQNVKEKDLLDLYPDTHITPKIVIRVEKGGIGKYATYTFDNSAEANIWMHQLNGKILLGRRITFKK